MGDRVTFLLHQDEDGAYAAALAQALAPRLVLPSAMSDAAKLGFGAGAICIALWSAAWTPVCSAAALVDLVTSKGSDALIVCLGGVAPAPEFVSARLSVAHAVGEVGADAAVIEAALDTLDRMAANDGFGAYRARLGTGVTARPSAKREWTRKMAARSAAGIAATVGVVVVASQYVNGRATAVMPEPQQPSPAASTPLPEARSLPEAPAAEPAGDAGAGSGQAETTGPDGLVGPQEGLLEETGRVVRTDLQTMLGRLEPIAMDVEPLQPLVLEPGRERDVLMAYLSRPAGSAPLSYRGAKRREKGAGG